MVKDSGLKPRDPKVEVSLDSRGGNIWDLLWSVIVLEDEGVDGDIVLVSDAWC